MSCTCNVDIRFFENKGPKIGLKTASQSFVVASSVMSQYKPMVIPWRLVTRRTTCLARNVIDLCIKKIRRWKRPHAVKHYGIDQ